MVTILSVAFTVDSVIVVTGSLAIACCHIRVTCSVPARESHIVCVPFPDYIHSKLYFLLISYLCSCSLSFFCSNPLGLSPDVRFEIKQILFLCG